MAEPAARAFGRYLRILRVRRGLSLLAVSRLCDQSPEKIDKGTLSRFEHGLQIPSFFKLSPLCRIYQVPAEALIERMELDREVERRGAPDTTCRDLEILESLGREALLKSRKWEAYACFRDCLSLADPKRLPRLSMNLATAIRSLGKNRLALHELETLLSSGHLDARRQAVVHDRMSHCHRCLGDMRAAEHHANLAVAESIRLGDPRTLAFAYFSRASTAVDQADYGRASRDLHLAFRAYRDDRKPDSLLSPNPIFEVHTLLLLAECQVHLDLIDRARTCTLAAKRLSGKHDLSTGKAYSEVLLGIIDDRTGRTARALQRWTLAADLAQSIDNQRLEVEARFRIFRQALHRQDLRRAEAARRRIERLAPWVSPHLPALREFRKLIESDDDRESNQIRATS